MKDDNSDIDKKKPTAPRHEETQVSRQKTHSTGRYVTIIFLSFVASFLGAWVFLQTGLVQVDSGKTITQNRKNIVVQEGEVVSEVAKKASPSVVSVLTKSISSQQFGANTQGAGTGVIISRDGYILTNKHVVGDATDVSIVTSDGTSYDNVSVVGVDPLNDLAFLKIKQKVSLQPAVFADSSNVSVGQKVIAIGNALGQYQTSVTSGIISGRGRPVVAENGQNGEQLDNLFQTDASINPGNSGGPLLDLNGEVIGINTAIAQDAQGIGFAIPSNAAKGLIKNLLKNGKVERSYLGIRYTNITPDVAERYKLAVKQGAYVFDQNGSAVVSGSPADKAGIKNKDIITKVDDKTVSNNNGLALLLAEHVPGDKVSLTVLRGGSQKKLEATLDQYRAP